MITGSPLGVSGENLLFKFKGGDLSTTLTYQLAPIYRPLVTCEEGGEVHPHLVVHVAPVLQKIGKNNCGNNFCFAPVARR